MTSCLVNRLDHIELVCADLVQMQRLFELFGFVNTQSRSSAIGEQRLMLQGKIRVLLTHGKAGSFQQQYLQKHGDGVCDLVYVSEDPQKTLATAVERGAELAQPLSEEKDGAISVQRASIKSFGDVRASFLKRAGAAAFDVAAPFAPGFEATGKHADPGVGFLSYDHLTNNVPKGEMDRWAKFYENVYGWREVRYFDIRGDETGLLSRAMQSPDGGLSIPVNEPTEKKSQIQEFLDQHHGAGVQHIAFATADIRKTVSELRKRGIKFLEVPDTYYEAIPARVPGVKEPLAELQPLRVLVDGDQDGYLLQIFTENQIGPLFFEIIQRRGHNGFGEGNFRALFEAIERDQRRRGVL